MVVFICESFVGVFVVWLFLFFLCFLVAVGFGVVAATCCAYLRFFEFLGGCHILSIFMFLD